jgi:hypothetical protein
LYPPFVAALGAPSPAGSPTTSGSSSAGVGGGGSTHGGLSERADSGFAVRAAAAGASSAVGAALSSPAALVKNRLQATPVAPPPRARGVARARGSGVALANSTGTAFAAAETHAYTGLLDGLRHIYVTEGGMAGWFRGASANIARMSVGGAVQLAAYDALKPRLRRALQLRDGVPLHFAASLAAVTLTATATAPLDLVTTRLYQSKGQATRYTGIVDCITQTVRAEGLLGLQQGWSAQMLRLGPHFVLTFIFIEQIRAAMVQLPALTRPGPAAGGG